MDCYAHSRPGRQEDQWESLEDHLQLVAKLTAKAASKLAAEDWGAIAGLWHDLGKYSTEFQKYLQQPNRNPIYNERKTLEVGHDEIIANKKGPDHSTAGAQHAVQQFGMDIGYLLACCIAGHHGGLADTIDDIHGGVSDMRSRLKKHIPQWNAAPDVIVNQAEPKLPNMKWLSNTDGAAFQLSVFSRFLFSCLVDGDFLATEEFYQGSRSRLYAAPDVSWGVLADSLRSHLVQLEANSTESTVNRERRHVLEVCREAATLPPGMFSLTVPTGGGKTLSSLSFALEHAACHDMQRVIYAMPFTSIIEQNAEVFRHVFRDFPSGVVLEHHSNLDSDQDTVQSRLASENWDAPIIVTTNVQLFESLFANRTSKCRKLHNIVRSVIVLDEVQTLPVEFLKPTLAMLEELRQNYHCTIVLCSATQPAVVRRNDFPIGLEKVHEIVPDAPRLFATLRRVEIELCPAMDINELADRLADQPQVLCVVNTKRDAAEVFEQLRNSRGDAYHLSTRMCPAHRSDTLAEVRRRLNDGNSGRCAVVSTQLIEAGVDIDFPVVYRAVAGLDSIAQAAGRCNREGRLPVGKVFVFERPISSVPGLLEIRKAADSTREVASKYDDLQSLDAVENYFRLHYWKRKTEWDKYDITTLFSLNKDGPRFQFRQCADRYRLIRDDQYSVVVPYLDGAKLIAEIGDLAAKDQIPDRRLNRRLQRYTVGVYEHELNQLRDNGAVIEIHERLFVQTSQGTYDDSLGLVIKSDQYPLVI